MDYILDKYSDDVLNEVNMKNLNKIYEFLMDEKCECIEDILEDYLDIFTIDYEIFKNKYEKLNQKYHNEYLKFVSEDMNLLEEFFYD